MDSDLIRVVNRVQDCFANLGGELDMPQLVVVGSQSSGKSSVLETIVGRDFLPRGSGIVTRRPLVLQLIHTPATDPPAQFPEYAHFLHLDRRFTDFAEVRKEIEEETFRVAGQNKGISKLPIHLRVYSPNVLDLTLVDLPGLTKVPVGDQPSDIERQIYNLVLEYTSKSNSVILAVSPANVDLANSEALKIARSVDPQGRRTIGVLTKLDLMDAGTNALDVLTGRVYPLKLGFIGVVNRSQQDIISEKSMSDALASETEFFKNHPAYRNIAHKNGTKYLARTLNQVLMNHIRDKLPDMKARLNTLIGQTKHELDSYGNAGLLREPVEQGALILRLMTQFARDYVASIEGTSLNISTKELSGGARVYYIFNDVFGHVLETIDTTKNLDSQDIRTAIRNSTGPRPSLFVPEMAFDLLVKPQIKLLEAPSLRCVELVYEELVKICHNCTNKELERFPRLHAQIVETVSELLRERLGPTSDYTQSLIAIQTSYINTNHPAFVASTQNLSKENSQPPRKPLAQRPAAHIEPPTINGVTSDEDNAEDTDRAEAILTGNRKDHRSASTSAAGRSSSTSRHHHHHRHSNTTSPAATSIPQRPNPQFLNQHPNTTKESFLNYFFGQGQGQGTNSVGGAASSAAVAGTTLSSTALMGSNSTSEVKAEEPDDGMSSGLLAPRRGLDGNTAAFDMRSLEKHIEAIPADGNPNMSPREEMEINLIRTLIASYFSIVRQTIQDLVPKSIMHFLVNYTSQHVQNRLVSALYKPNLFSELLSEDETLVAERTRVSALLDAYREAFKTLSEISLKPV